MPPAKSDRALAATVRSLREQGGVSREALALQAGVTYGALARIELAQSSPTWDTLRRIAAVLDLSIGRLTTLIERAEHLRVPDSKQAPSSIRPHAKAEQTIRTKVQQPDPYLNCLSFQYGWLSLSTTEFHTY